MSPHGVEKFTRVFTGVAGVIRHPYPLKKNRPPGAGSLTGLALSAVSYPRKPFKATRCPQEAI